MEGRIALFDMDGTLFDHDAQMRADLERIASPGETIPEILHDCEDIPWMKARFDLIRRQPGGGGTCPILNSVGMFYRFASVLAFVAIFSLRVRSPIRMPGLKRWSASTITWDGTFPSTSWLAIMPDHPYNRDFQHPNVIRYAGQEDMPLVEKVLQAVYDRKSGEHWRDLI